MKKYRVALIVLGIILILLVSLSVYLTYQLVNVKHKQSTLADMHAWPDSTQLIL